VTERASRFDHRERVFLAPQHSETKFYADRISVVNAQWKNVVDSVLVAVA